MKMVRIQLLLHGRRGLRTLTRTQVYLILLEFAKCYYNAVYIVISNFAETVFGLRRIIVCSFGGCCGHFFSSPLSTASDSATSTCICTPFLSLFVSDMSYADELASSDPPEETGTEQPVAAVNETGDTIVDQETNDGFNCDTELRSHGNSRQSSLSQRAYSRSPSIGSTTSSLGRRSREIGPGYFSHREKVHIREFTQEKCTEYELPPNERAIIMQNSEVRLIISIS